MAVTQWKNFSEGWSTAGDSEGTLKWEGSSGYSIIESLQTNNAISAGILKNGVVSGVLTLYQVSFSEIPLSSTIQGIEVRVVRGAIDKLDAFQTPSDPSDDILLGDVFDYNVRIINTTTNSQSNNIKSSPAWPRFTPVENVFSTSEIIYGSGDSLNGLTLNTDQARTSLGFQYTVSGVDPGGLMSMAIVNSIQIRVHYNDGETPPDPEPEVPSSTNAVFYTTWF